VPRRQRVFLEGGSYHVYCRLTRREAVFADSEAGGRFVEILREVKRQDRFTVLAWCVMPTHYHLALRTGEVPLWRSMRLIQGRFAQWHNRAKGVIGPVWQGRYKAKLVDDPRYLDEVILYIHLNPTRAGLGLGYRLCGHRELVGRSRSPLLDVDDALLGFGEGREAALATYRQAIAAGRRDDGQDEEPVGLPWWRKRAGDEPLHPAADRPFVDEQGRSSAPERPELDAALLVRRAAVVLKVELAALVSPSRERSVVRARDLVCGVGAERYGVKVRDLAAALRRTADQVSRGIGRARRRRVSDGGFAQDVERLDRALSGSGPGPDGE
jgi:REP element-mobilizing transposase RayT